MSCCERMTHFLEREIVWRSQWHGLVMSTRSRDMPTPIEVPIKFCPWCGAEVRP